VEGEESSKAKDDVDASLGLIVVAVVVMDMEDLFQVGGIICDQDRECESP